MSNTKVINNVKFMGNEDSFIMTVLSDNYSIKTKTKARRNEGILYCAEDETNDDMIYNKIHFKSAKIYNLFRYTCGTRKNEELFLKEFYEGKQERLLDNLLEFREYLINNRMNHQYSIEELKQILHNGDIEELHSTLELIFMDKISIDDVNYLLKVIEKRGYTLEKLINRHNKKPRETFYSCISMSLW